MKKRPLLDRETLNHVFGDLWPVHHNAFTALLLECARHFDGDLREMLILSVIGDRTLGSGRTSGLSYTEFVAGRRVTGTERPINTQSVAEVSGIPRETVRRKVDRLVGRGWVRRDSDGSLWVTNQAAVDLAPATQATFDYFLAVGNALLESVNPARD